MGENSDQNTLNGGKISDQELEKQYKRCLENWREVLVHMNSLLLWDKPYYPGIIGGYITFVFMVLWYFEPSILTAVSLLGAIAFILDFTVPILSSSVFDSNKWTGVQERKYEEICQSLVHVKKRVEESWQYLSDIKERKPRMYFFGMVSGLLIMAWIGNLVDNLFLTYFIVLTTALSPGIKHHGIMQQQISHVCQAIKGIIDEKKKKAT